LSEIGVGRLLYDFFAQSAVHGDHFSAHGIFVDAARFVVGMPRTRPLHDRLRQQSFFRRQVQFPVEKTFPGVFRPERAVAIKRGEARFQAEYGFEEFGLQRCEMRHEI
jgi:hypothetical protein